jgi:hypothetical protein
MLGKKELTKVGCIQVARLRAQELTGRLTLRAQYVVCGICTYVKHPYSYRVAVGCATAAWLISCSLVWPLASKLPNGGGWGGRHNKATGLGSRTPLNAGVFKITSGCL